MKGFYTILLLIVSNVFMTFAWYGHLKMKQEYSWFAALSIRVKYRRIVLDLSGMAARSR